MGTQGTFLYRPSFGAQGATEYTTFDTGLLSADAELLTLRLHRLASTSIHGVAGSVVGTTDIQTLTNKTLTIPIIGDFTSSEHEHETVAGGGQLDHGLAMSGLDDDDHVKYSLADGTRVFTSTISGTTFHATDASTAIRSTGSLIIYPGTGRVYIKSNAGAIVPTSLYFVDDAYALHTMGWTLSGDGTTTGTRLTLSDSNGVVIYAFTEDGSFNAYSVSAVTISGNSGNFTGTISAGTFDSPVFTGGVLATRVDSGSTFTRRNRLNFIQGGNIAITGFDDVGQDETRITLSASSGGASVSTTKKLILPASVWETRGSTTNWAQFVQTQGTNLDYGELDFDASSDEKAFSPPFHMTGWAGGAMTGTVGWKCNSTTTTQSAVWVVQSLGLVHDEVWDAAFTQNVSAAGSPTASAENLLVKTFTFTPANITTEDVVIWQIYRNADDATYDTLTVDAKLLFLQLEYV